MALSRSRRKSFAISIILKNSLFNPRYRDDLKYMFKESVDKTLVLIARQANQILVSEKKLRVRVSSHSQIQACLVYPVLRNLQKIFLSGGFAKSEYLFEKVKEFGTTRKIDVERGDDW
jgi:hypothetical protein